MPTLWNGKDGMRITLKYQITNYDADLRLSVYLAEDDRWFTILVALNNPNATRTFWHADLREALDLADLRMVSEEPPEETIDEGTEVTPSGPHTRYTRAELKES